MNFNKIGQKSLEVVEKVAAYIKKEALQFDKSGMEFKGKNNIVTKVDKKAELMLVDGLKNLEPAAGFITEENTVEQQQREIQWILDPLDGTTNFVYGIPCYSISAALKVGDEVKLGIVYEINRDECFTAWEGRAPTLNGREICVSNVKKLEDTLLATGLPYFDFEVMDQYMNCIRQLLETSRGMRRMGSAAIDLAYVACGKFDGFFEYSLNPWDVAAGAYLVQRAGGKVSDFSGGENYLFGKEIVAGSFGIFEEFLGVIKNCFEK